MDTSALLEKVIELLTVYGIKFLAAIAIFIIGRWVAKGVTRFIERVLKNKEVDKTLVSFVGNLKALSCLFGR